MEGGGKGGCPPGATTKGRQVKILFLYFSHVDVQYGIVKIIVSFQSKTIEESKDDIEKKEKLLLQGSS